MTTQTVRGTYAPATNTANGVPAPGTLCTVQGNLAAASQALGISLDSILEESELHADNGKLFRADVDGTRYLIKSPKTKPCGESFTNQVLYGAAAFERGVGAETIVTDELVARDTRVTKYLEGTRPIGEQDMQRIDIQTLVANALRADFEMASDVNGGPFERFAAGAMSRIGNLRAAGTETLVQLDSLEARAVWLENKLMERVHHQLDTRRHVTANPHLGNALLLRESDNKVFMTSQRDNSAVPFWKPIARLFWTARFALSDSSIEPFLTLYFKREPTESEVQAVRMGIAINNIDYFCYFSELYPDESHKYIMESRMYGDTQLIPGLYELIHIRY